MKCSVIFLTTILTLSAELRAEPTTLITLDTLKAFPTAEGAGADVSGGRGGKVTYVINRNRTGPGSLHDALKDAAILPTENARTIVFAIGGRFDLSDGIFLGYLKAKEQGGSNRGENLYNNFTLAGQTAWDKGGVHMATEGPLRLKGAPELGVYGQENMILRYFDTRYNWEWYVARNELGKQPSIRFTNSSDFIIDHMTSGWSSYGLIATNSNKNFYYDKTVDNISVQRSLFHENIIDPTTTKPQKNHNVGLLLGVAQSNNELNDWNKVGTFSIHKNAFIGVSHRFPNMAGSENAKLNFTNNFIHGFNGGGVKRLGRTAGNTHHDFINNTFQETPYSPQFSSENLIAIDYENFLSKAYPLENVTPNFHIDGNLFLSNSGERLAITDSVQNSNGRDMLFVWIPSNQVGMPRLVLRDTPNPPLKIAVSTLNANDLKANILNNVGGNVRFSSDGSTNVDNPIDAEYIRWAVENDAPTTLTSSLGDGGIGDRSRFVHPTYNTEEAVDLDTYDSDRDGMPNDWEEQHGLTLNSVMDDTDLANNENNLVRDNRDWIFDEYLLVRNTAGYTNLEMYLADVAGDFHMLAQSGGTPIVTVEDGLKSITINDISLIIDNTVAARIEYSAATDRQIKCYLQITDTKETIAFTKVDVSAGSDIAECNLELPSPLVPTRLYVYITTTDGKWSNRLDEIIIPIEIPEDFLGLSNFPSVVIAGETATAKIEYDAAGDRVIKLFLQNAGTGETIAVDRIDVEAGSGLAQFTLDVPSDVPADSIYRMYVYITTPDGKWSHRTAEITSVVPIGMYFPGDDSLLTIFASHTIKLGTTLSVPVEYIATAGRRIKCFLQNTTTNETFAMNSENVDQGYGFADCDIPVPSDLPTQESYQLYIYITTADGKWSNRLDEATIALSLLRR